MGTSVAGRLPHNLLPAGRCLQGSCYSKAIPSLLGAINRSRVVAGNRMTVSFVFKDNFRCIFSDLSRCVVVSCSRRLL